MAKGGHVYERGLSVGRLQGECEIDGHRGRAVSTRRIDDREDLTANAFLSTSALRSLEPYKGVDQIRGVGGALDKFSSPRAHGIDNHLRLIQIADGKDRSVGHLLVQHFNRAQ